ncbi:beta-glucanosyltransferase gel2 [Grosmannia clavigera kw1407]|uniref:1,3-beta-glucanosyltransferase n=1 Tax=Grosmannia clavigera (strain kw1407 / UAMH 11150) TaxID=655863 RepID=F0X9H4_GROCL|nr:beta-glucanosyltransferase gel2 [Grosmannia clavigera kw1407]EFX05374.1 beta-glucanosyltransferase gel2 [Grosmannia clavigera kw1407]
MKMQGSLLAAASVLVPLASAVTYVTVDGGEFVNNATGNRMDIIGVTYQPGGSSGFDGTADPLSDADACLRDAILMQQLGVNTLRVYNVAPDLNHDECVSIFNAAGIYMLIDVNSGLSGQYIDRSDPSTTYTLAYLKHIFAVVEAFWGYPNLLGFFAGNEVLNEDSSDDAAIYIRAIVRDLKEYIALHSPRAIGVGYSAADVDTMLSDTWNYLGCTLANSTYSRIDFFGLNDYEWCGDSSYTESGYNKLVAEFADTDIPVFFSEYGCNLVTPRTFTNVPVLYGSEMTGLSGGLVYEYSQETDNYGLVAINSSTEVTLLSDFVSLKAQYLSLDQSLLMTANKSLASASTSTCGASLITESAVPTSWDLPDRPSGGNALVTSGLTSASTGALTSVTATTMPATVYDTAGSTVTGYSLVSFGCSDVNYPGLAKTYSASAQTCVYASSTAKSDGSTAGSGSSTSTSTSTGKKSGTSRTAVGPFADKFGLAITAGLVILSLGGALAL